mgnify:FL=1
MPVKKFILSAGFFRKQHKMKTKEAVKHYGGQRGLCEALGLKSRQAISAWGEKPPIQRQFQLEVLTNGVLRADRQSDYRPDASVSNT